MTLGEIMSCSPVTLDARTDLRLAARILDWAGATCAPVIEDGAVIGVVDRRDLATRIEGAGSVDTVAAAARLGVDTAAPGDSVEQAAERFETRSMRCLLIVDASGFVGIVTPSDVASALRAQR